MSTTNGGIWRVLNPVLAVLAVVAVAAAGWAGYRWWSAGQGGGADVAATRDGALEAAKQLVVTLQTVDPTHAEDSMASWQAAATGSLLRKLRNDSPKYLAELKKTPSTSQATVVDAAVSGVDAAAGTATVIAALDVLQAPVVKGVPGPSTKRQLRVKLTLSRTDQGWKVSSSGLVNA